MADELILDLGVEGGGARVFGRRVEGGWEFRLHGSSFALDENDDEDWRTWTTDPSSDLFALLPRGWRKFYPIAIHPEFVEAVRREYERGAGRNDGCQRSAWRRLFDRPPGSGLPTHHYRTDPTP